jgi:hypothetical protein
LPPAAEQEAAVIDTSSGAVIIAYFLCLEAHFREDRKKAENALKESGDRAGRSDTGCSSRGRVANHDNLRLDSKTMQMVGKYSKDAKIKVHEQNG